MLKTRKGKSKDIENKKIYLPKQKVNTNRLKLERGITLIALVITIIVLLILAGVTIANLTGENRILTKASQASENTREANAEEQVKLAVSASIGEDGKINLDDLNNELSKIEGLTYNGNPISNSNKIESLPATVTVDGYDITINGNGSIENNPNEGDTEQSVVDGVTIPEGFYYVGGTKDTGLVISDVKGDDLDNTKQGNQFVWVPVENYSEFIRREGYCDGNLQSMLSECGEADSTGTNSLFTETATTQAEAQEMYASVEKNKGFYIGRYETGKDSNGNVVVKKGVDVYNNIQWSANGAMQETQGTTGGAVELARNFDTANNYTSVTSTLIYGGQWDAVMKWMENIENPNATGSLTKYIQDSTGMGWYSNNSGSTVHKAGIDLDSNKSNCVKNIYDLAGNAYEWTMESYNTYARNFRGGHYNDIATAYTTSSRNGDSPSISYDSISFRLTLYL